MNQDISQSNISEVPLCIACGSDDTFAMPLAVTLYSALTNLDVQTSVEIFIVDGGITTRSKQRLDYVVDRARPDAKLHWVKISEEMTQGLVGARHLSSATWLRLFLPILLPNTFTHVIYLDCDLLVMNDLTKLWQENLEGHAIGAVKDYLVAGVSHPFSDIKDYNELGLSAETPMFNAGVMLLDLTRWRDDHLAENVLAYGRKQGERLGNCDQTALNVMLPTEWKPIDPRWNVQTSLLYLELETASPWKEMAQSWLTMRPTLLREANIYHFTGTPKPWNHWLYHPATAAWAVTLLRSGWFRRSEAIRWAINYWIRFFSFRTKVRFGLHKVREQWT